MDNLTETEKNIRLSWAINNTTQVMCSRHGAQDWDDEDFDKWVDYFLNYFTDKKDKLWPKTPPKAPIPPSNVPFIPTSHNDPELTRRANLEPSSARYGVKK